MKMRPSIEGVKGGRDEALKCFEDAAVLCLVFHVYLFFLSFGHVAGLCIIATSQIWPCAVLSSVALLDFLFTVAPYDFESLTHPLTPVYSYLWIALFTWFTCCGACVLIVFIVLRTCLSLVLYFIGMQWCMILYKMHLRISYSFNPSLSRSVSRLVNSWLIVRHSFSQFIHSFIPSFCQSPTTIIIRE